MLWVWSCLFSWCHRHDPNLLKPKTFWFNIAYKWRHWKHYSNIIIVGGLNQKGEKILVWIPLCRVHIVFDILYNCLLSSRLRVWWSWWLPSVSSRMGARVGEPGGGPGGKGRGASRGDRAEEEEEEGLHSNLSKSCQCRQTPLHLPRLPPARLRGTAHSNAEGCEGNKPLLASQLQLRHSQCRVGASHEAHPQWWGKSEEVTDAVSIPLLRLLPLASLIWEQGDAAEMDTLRYVVMLRIAQRM